MPRLDFEYFEQDNPPSSPFVEIFLADYSSGKDGKPLLFPRLYSNGEIDERINKLIKELELIRKKAKSKLK